MEGREPTLSFGFTKIAKKNILKRSGPLDDGTGKDLEQVDFVTGLVGSQIQGTLKKPKKDELVIPLLSQPGGWAKPTQIISSNAFGHLLNVVGSERSTLEDYDRVPVEDFGLAMLRGMGWKESEGIGLKNKRVVEMREPEVRPRGLGLGAERPQANKDVLPPSKSKEGAKTLTLKIGAFAVINKGSNKGSYGEIQSFDEDNNRVIMKLNIGSKMVTVSKFYIDLVDEEQHKKKSRVLNNEKYEEYLSKQPQRTEQPRLEERDDNRRRYESPDDRSRSRSRENGHSIRRRRSDSSDADDLKHRSKSHKKKHKKEKSRDKDHRSKKRKGSRESKDRSKRRKEKDYR